MEKEFESEEEEEEEEEEDGGMLLRLGNYSIGFFEGMHNRNKTFTHPQS